jgi:hypothetical protein
MNWDCSGGQRTTAHELQQRGKTAEEKKDADGEWVNRVPIVASQYPPLLHSLSVSRLHFAGKNSLSAFFSHFYFFLYISRKDAIANLAADPAFLLPSRWVFATRGSVARRSQTQGAGKTAALSAQADCFGLLPQPPPFASPPPLELPILRVAWFLFPPLGLANAEWECVARSSRQIGEGGDEHLSSFDRAASLDIQSHGAGHAPQPLSLFPFLPSLPTRLLRARREIN